MGRYLPFVLLLGACSSKVAYFKPNEQLKVERGRPPAATYPMRSSDGAEGTTRLWSSGVYVAKGRNVAHVAVELESTGSSGMRFDLRSMRLKAHKGDEATPDLIASATIGPTEIPPRGYARIDTFFELPDSMSPRSVSEFEVRWSAQIGDERKGETTTFGRSAVRGRNASYFHGPYMPGSGMPSPTGAWFSCPDDPNSYYPYPPDCP